MRIALVTSYWEEGSWDLETVLLRSLVEGLRERDCETVIFTTTSSAPVPTYSGALAWNRCYPEGGGSEGPRAVNRFPPAGRGRAPGACARRPRSAWWERVETADALGAYCSRALPAAHGIVAAGWHDYEIWADGPGRWSRGPGTLLLWGNGVERVEMRVLSPLEQAVEVMVAGAAERVAFGEGEEKDVACAVPLRESLSVFLRPEKTFRPAADRRELGLGLRGLRVKDATGWHEVSIEPDLSRPPAGYWEKIPSEFAPAPASLPGDVERLWRDIVGPRTRGLRRALEERAGGYDLVICARSHHYTACTAARAARAAGKPLVLVPLLSRGHVLESLPFLAWQVGYARGVADPQPLWEEWLREAGKPFFHLPPPALFPSPLDDVCDGGEVEEWRARLAGEDGLPFPVAVGVEGSRRAREEVMDVLRHGHAASAAWEPVLLGREEGNAGASGRERVEWIGDEGIGIGDEGIAGPAARDFSSAPPPLQRLLLRVAEIYCQAAWCEDWGWKLCLALAWGKETLAPRDCPLAASITGLLGMGISCEDAPSCVRSLSRVTAEHAARPRAQGGGEARGGREEAFRAARQKHLDGFADWLASIL